MSKLILISAPSGTGKTTMSRLLKSSDVRFSHVQVLTTRTVRASESGRGEKEQITLQELEQLEKNNELVNKNEKDGVWYGIKKSAISAALDQKLTPVLEWDLNRLDHFDEFFPTFKVILEPESLKEIKARVKRDNRDPNGNRLKGMIKEVKLIKSGFYDKKSDFRIINRGSALNDTILKIRWAYFNSLN
ncbi:MAG: hypothetical protein ABJL44_15455 [Algibacter sp.]